MTTKTDSKIETGNQRYNRLVKEQQLRAEQRKTQAAIDARKASRKAYWNPFADLANGSYDKVHAEANSFVGKDVEVVRDDNVRVIGKLTRVSTCSDGALGLTINVGSCDRWVSPDFKSIKIVTPLATRAAAIDANTQAARINMKRAIDARDQVRNLAATNSTWESELHKMADRLDVIAKQIGLAALTLKS